MTATLTRPVEIADLDAPRPADGPPAHPRPPGRLQRFWRGPSDDPAWARPSLLALLGATALLYLWNLSASGTANSFYAAAVQAGTKSWKAFFFGSFDASSYITVDKPPASLWVMELSGRIFGFNSWSLLAPQALEGVAAVALLYAAVRRWHGPGAGLFAGAALALTPAAALMFRFDNPDALLTLLLVAGAYCVVRAVEVASTRWLLLAGTAVGFAFLTKMLQAFLVLPAFALVYLACAPTRLRRRIGQVLAAGLAVIASAGWWVAIVELWPSSSRPYIGGSTDNSVLNLVFGYNGLGRLFGQGGGNGGGRAPSGSGGSAVAQAFSGGGAPGGGGNQSTGFGGATGLGRLFRGDIGFEISWLLPAALLCLVFGLIVTRRAPRTDRTRASLILWGGWLLVTGVVFSYMQGVFHPYYTVALAPAIVALVAITVRELWSRRDADAPEGMIVRAMLATVVAATTVWDFALLDRNASWLPALRWTVAAAGVVVVSVLMMGTRIVKRTALAVGAATAIVGLTGTASYAIATAGNAHTGSIPSVGPSSAAGQMGGGPGGGAIGATGGFGPMGATGATGASGPTGTAGATGASGSSSPPAGATGGAGMGEQTANSALVALLQKTTTRWAAATGSSQSAAPLELASGKAVMAMGGFSGSDAAITLAQLQAYVADGDIAYYIAGGGMGGPGGGSNAQSEITAWVESHYTAITVGGTTVYDLSQPTS